MGDIGKQVAEQAKQAAKQAGKKVKQAIWEAIAPALPYIAIGVAIFVMIVLVICMFENFSDVGITTVDAAATGWWWPIGSEETTKEDGKLFASGTPALGGSDVWNVGANGGSKWGINAGDHNHSQNIGLDIGARGQTNKYYVVSVGNGTVTQAFDNVPENTIGTSSATNWGCGNYVEVDYGEIIVRYLHLYHGSIQVKVGDTVSYGQVIGKIGYNGDADGIHSHTDYRDQSGTYLDPVDIVDPNDPRPVTNGSYSNLSSGVIGSNVQDKVWYTLTNAGYSEYAVAGVMGNISQESSWDCESVNAIGAKGLCQWLDRAPALENYATSKGTDWTDVDTQIEFLLGEINPNGGANGCATFQGSGNPLYDEWKTTTSVSTAAVDFRKWFERCGESEANDNYRIEEAEKFYNHYHGKKSN